MVCMEGAALAAIVKAEGRCQQVGAAQMDCDSEGRSHASCSTDTSLGGRLSDSAEQQANKTHHLLRHCLNSGQRDEALQHFSSQDVKEAAKEISRMGQRELQGKFKVRAEGGSAKWQAGWLAGWLGSRGAIAGCVRQGFDQSGAPAVARRGLLGSSSERLPCSGWPAAAAGVWQHHPQQQQRLAAAQAV